MKQWQIFLMAGLFLAVCNSLESAEAATSPVTVQSDMTSVDIMTDDGSGSNFVVATLTLTNTDTTQYRTMEVYLVATSTWSTEFTDTDWEELEDYTVSLTKGGSAAVKLIMYCDGACSPGDVDTVQVFAKTDPRWYHNGDNASDENNTSNENNTCGSDDCETDTTPASHSTNVTGMVSIVLTARTAYDSSMSCDVASSEGDNEVSKGQTTLWGYMVENTGWMTDTYQFVSVVTSADGHEVSYWSVLPGLTDGKELTGQSDSSTTAVHTAEASISITPATGAKPGVYNIELTVTSTGGAPPAGCDFDVIIYRGGEISLEILELSEAFISDYESGKITSTSQVESYYTSLKEDGVCYTGNGFDESAPDDSDSISYSNGESFSYNYWDIVNNYNSMSEALVSQEHEDNLSNMIHGVPDNGTSLIMIGLLKHAEMVVEYGEMFGYKYEHKGVCNAIVVEEETTKDPANETAEEETEKEIEEAPREVPSISLIPALLSIGIIALRRRY